MNLFIKVLARILFLLYFLRHHGLIKNLNSSSRLVIFNPDRYRSEIPLVEKSYPRLTVVHFNFFAGIYFWIYRQKRRNIFLSKPDYSYDFSDKLYLAILRALVNKLTAGEPKVFLFPGVQYVLEKDICFTVKKFGLDVKTVVFQREGFYGESFLGQIKVLDTCIDAFLFDEIFLQHPTQYELFRKNCSTAVHRYCPERFQHYGDLITSRISGKTKKKMQITLFSFRPDTSSFLNNFHRRTYSAWDIPVGDHEKGGRDLLDIEWFYADLHKRFLQLAVELPEVEFVIKTKWGGGWSDAIMDLWILAFGKIDDFPKNCSVITEGNAESILTKSSCAICWGSTVGFEAQLASVPCIFPRYGECFGPRVQMVDPYFRFRHEVTTASSGEDFQNKLRSFIAGDCSQICVPDISEDLIDITAPNEKLCLMRIGL